MRGLRGPLAALLVIGAVVGAGTATDHRLAAPAPAARVVAATGATLVCPDVFGRGSHISSRLSVAEPAAPGGVGQVRIGRLAPGTRPAAAALTGGGLARTVNRPGGPVVVTAAGAGAASLAAEQSSLVDRGAGRGLTATRCEAPRANWWFVGADGRVGHQDAVVVGNPGDSPATVHVHLLTSGARAVAAPSLETFTVAARSARTLQLPKVAPDVPAIAVHISTSEGLVTAALRDERISGTTPQGSDWLPASAPAARTVVLPGLGGPGRQQLVLADPGRQAAQIDVRLLTSGGAFVPNGRSRIDVPGGETAPVDLTTALRGRSGAVQLTSDQPVLAGAMATVAARHQLPDLLWRAGAAPLSAGDTWAQGWTGQGRSVLLSVAAPGAGGRLTLRDAAGGRATVAVPAASSTTVDLRKLLRAPHSGPGWVTVSAVTGGLLYAAQTLAMTGAHGPLIAGSAASRPAANIHLPPLTDDPGGAVRP
jgi:hypothetical protein